jgi:hypothetical protein
MMAANQLDFILSQVQQLSVNEQLQLIKRVAELLGRAGQPQPVRQPTQGLVYGKYKDAPGQMSTEEDFRIPERLKSHKIRAVVASPLFTSYLPK